MYVFNMFLNITLILVFIVYSTHSMILTLILYFQNNSSFHLNSMLNLFLGMLKFPDNFKLPVRYPKYSSTW